MSPEANEVARVVAAFAALADLDLDHDSDAVRMVATAALRDVWTAARYKSEFAKAPELDELTTTPFMLEIVTEVLPELSSSSQSVNAVKAELVAALGEVCSDGYRPRLSW